MANGVGAAGNQMGGAVAGFAGGGLWRADYAIDDAGRDDGVCQRGGLECAVAADFGWGGGVCGRNGIFGLGAEYAADGDCVYAGIVAVEHGVLAACLRVHGGGDGGADGLGATADGGSLKMRLLGFQAALLGFCLPAPRLFC